MKTARTTFLLALLVLSAFAVGRHFPISDAHARSTLYSELGLFTEVLSVIQDRYVDEVDDTRLMRGAVRGMVAELDAHSAWLTPEELASMREDNRNEYVGVGMEVGMDGDWVVVHQVFDEGPAEQAGIASGDRILKVDDEEVLGLNVQEVVQRIRGRRGTPVTIDIQRQGDDEEWEERHFDMVRDVIRRTLVHRDMVAPGIGHIRVEGFRMQTTEEVRAAIEALERDSDDGLDGLVMDLRGNTGGLLREAIMLSDLFLDRGTIVSMRGQGDSDGEEWTAQRRNTAWRGPLVLLVDERSASASEIFAGALQDHSRAVIVGEPTFGKGSVQSLLDLSDGSGLKLTISLYYTPNGSSIQQYGITPDFLVEAGEVDEEERSSRESRLERSLQRPEDGAPPVDVLRSIRDRQLRASVQQLHVYRVFSEAR